MGRSCFISFKTEDALYKEAIQKMNLDIVDKSLNEAIDSDNEDYILRKIREDYLADSTVTIHLIGSKSAENLGEEEQRYIKRELQASLYHGESNTRNGILGVVLPSMYERIYLGPRKCNDCGSEINILNISDETTIKEFHRNYFIPSHTKCHYTEDDRYCVLVSWHDFIANPSVCVEQAFLKRDHEISDKIKVRPE
ncbi:MAG: TIR domain-containing protein [Patescibacteria group bacterium]